MTDSMWNSDACKDILAAVCKAKIVTGELATCCTTEPREIERSNMAFVLSAICESKYLSKRVQIRRPRSKKRRIRKKWAKRESNFRTIPDRHVYIAAGRIFCHPEVARELRERFLVDGELTFAAGRRI